MLAIKYSLLMKIESYPALINIFKERDFHVIAVDEKDPKRGHIFQKLSTVKISHKHFKVLHVFDKNIYKFRLTFLINVIRNYGINMYYSDDRRDSELTKHHIPVLIL